MWVRTASVLVDPTVTSGSDLTPPARLTSGPRTVLVDPTVTSGSDDMLGDRQQEIYQK